MGFTKLSIPQGPGVTVERLANQLQFQTDRLVNQLNKHVGTAGEASTQTIIQQQNSLPVNFPNPSPTPIYIQWAGSTGTTSFLQLNTKGLSQGYIVGTHTTTTLSVGTDALNSVGDIILGNGTSTTSVRIAYNTFVSNESTFNETLIAGTNSLVFGVGGWYDNTPRGIFSHAGTANLNTATANQLQVTGTAGINKLLLSTGLAESDIVNLTADLAGKSGTGHTHSYTYWDGTHIVTGTTGPG